MSLQFTREEVEQRIADCVKNGDRLEIARISSIGYEIIKQYLNPDNERESPFFKALLIQCAQDENNPKRGEEMHRAYCEMREMSLRRSGQKLDMDRTFCETVREDADVVVAHAEHKPLDDQLREVNQAIEAKQRHRDSIIEAIRTERDSHYIGNVRQIARNAVASKNGK